MSKAAIMVICDEERDVFCFRVEAEQGGRGFLRREACVCALLQAGGRHIVYGTRQMLKRWTESLKAKWETVRELLRFLNTDEPWENW